jgi:hypothetical protein
MLIIVNRVSLIMFNKSKARKVACLITISVLLVCAAIGIVWLPARRGQNPYVDIICYWEKLGGVAIMAIDGGLNLYFIKLIRKELVAVGLTKYKKLYRFNCGMIVVSMSLDVSLPAMMHEHVLTLTCNSCLCWACKFCPMRTCMSSFWPPACSLLVVSHFRPSTVLMNTFAGICKRTPSPTS